MSAAKKPRTPSRSPQTRQIEFTPGQMIIAICTLIAFGLVCFMLGVLVNKLDSTFGTDAPAVATQQESPELPETTAAAPPPRQQTSPIPPESLRNQVASRNETPAGQPRTVPPPSANRTPERPAQPVAPPPTPPVVPDAPAEEPEPVVLEPIEEDEAPEPEPEPRVLENTELITPAEAPDAPEPPPVTRGGTAYGVQIASLSAEREEQARRALADAERVANQSGQLIRTDDGRHFRLIIGSFETRAEASRLQESMREHSQFEGCFVQTFTQPL